MGASKEYYGQEKTYYEVKAQKIARGAKK